MKAEKQKKVPVGRPTSGNKQILPDDIVGIVEKTQERIDKNFCTLIVEHNMRNIDVLNTFSPILGSASEVSKILNGKQHVSKELCAAVHYIFGVSLDQFIAGDIKKPCDRDQKIQRALEQARNLTKELESLQ